MRSGYSGGVQSVDPSRFAQVPRADIPRSVFQVDSGYKTTFDAGFLVPVYLDEVLPGDSHKLEMTVFSRLSTLIFPLMDNLKLCSFFFFVPNRLVWDHWQEFMGEQVNPGDSIDFSIPRIAQTGAFAPVTIFDYFGLPTGAHVTSGPWDFSALPFRAYNLIYNEWFRDENLQNSVDVPTDDGPDSTGHYNLLRRGKRHDYFTSALPFAQKGAPVTVPLGGQAIVQGIAVNTTGDFVSGPFTVAETGNATASYARATIVAGNPNPLDIVSPNTQEVFVRQGTDGLPQVYADLSSVAAFTINTLRQSFAIQKLLERDARGGTRYTEILQAHFGVHPPDFRLQRPEYLGGGCTPVNITPVAQTSQTATTPLANLAGVGITIAKHGFSQSFTEHGYIIGLVHVGADLTYFQGLQRHWSRLTRYDFYWPEFAHLGEQSVLRKEIYLTGVEADDNMVFGYQERFAEYRYKPSQITGMFRGDISGTLDAWHLAQVFTSAPTLSDTFIKDTPPVDRVVAAGDLANGQQFLFDSVFSVRKVRPMPMYGVPGFIDRF